MFVTPSGIVMLVKPEQPENALSPILVTLLGIVMFVKPEQSENAPFPMFVSPVITTVFKESGTECWEKFPPKRYHNCVSVVSLAFAPINGIEILFKPEHPENTPYPILVALFGIVIVFKEVQPLKTYRPRLFTLFGIVISVIFEQPEKA